MHIAEPLRHQDVKLNWLAGMELRSTHHAGCGGAYPRSVISLRCFSVSALYPAL